MEGTTLLTPKFPIFFMVTDIEFYFWASSLVDNCNNSHSRVRRAQCAICIFQSCPYVRPAKFLSLRLLVDNCNHSYSCVRSLQFSICIFNHVLVCAKLNSRVWDSKRLWRPGWGGWVAFFFLLVVGAVPSWGGCFSVVFPSLWMNGKAPALGLQKDSKCKIYSYAAMHSCRVIGSLCHYSVCSM